MGACGVTLTKLERLATGVEEGTRQIQYIDTITKSFHRTLRASRSLARNAWAEARSLGLKLTASRARPTKAELRSTAATSALICR